VSHIKGSSTPVNLSEELRRDSGRGFRDASADMIANLDQQLIDFKQKVRESPEEYHVVPKPGATGGGSVDGWMVAVAALLAAATKFGAARRRS
jgi:rhombotail lipoprotein